MSLSNCRVSYLSARRILIVLLTAVLASPLAFSQAAAPSPAAKRSAVTKKSQPDAGEGSAQAANGAEPGQPTAPKPATVARLAALPAPLPPALTQGIDVEARSQEILAHLSEIIRFYRMTVTPVQKIGEPSDMLYAEQAETVATQAAQLAFQSARDEAALLARIQGKPGAANTKGEPAETQKLAAAQLTAARQIQDLQAQSEALDQQLATARGASRAALEQQKESVEGQLELSNAMAEALAKVTGISSAQGDTGLQGQINRLQQAAPELVNSKVKPVANTLESLGSMHDAGVSTQGSVLFQLITTEHGIDDRIQEVQKLHDQALDLRTPLLKILRATLTIGQKMQKDEAASAAAAASGTAPATAAPSNDLAATRKTYDQLTDAFKTISGVSIPISQEVLLLEQARGNLLSWRGAVDSERKSVLHWLLLRVLFIALALGLILGLGELWRRATARYVQDLRRRRQLLLIRRMVVGFLSGLVLILGFVTQFSSLATFAGFITAGIAVGLQTILLSVAAYFFIVGRFGVRVGDRITVANVTGDVVEVGLVRFYMMELTGTGTELHPTGRIAVFANSVLFQTGTPLYKQIPGTDYAWHEMTVKLKPGTDYRPALDVIRKTVEKVYDGYKGEIEQQHAQVESWMDAAVKVPGIESRLQLTDGLQYVVLYPVRISDAGATDEQIVQEVLDDMSRDPAISQVIDGPPTVKAVIKS